MTRGEREIAVLMQPGVEIDCAAEATKTVVLNGSVQPITLPQARGESFVESGLPQGTAWQISIGTNATNLTSEPSTSQYINVTVPFGLYYYTVNEIPGYELIGSALSNQGFLQLTRYNSNYSYSATFVKCTIGCNSTNQTLSYRESGLAPGTKWSLTINGTLYSSYTPFINITEDNGAHTYQVSSIDGLIPYPNYGTVNLESGSSAYNVAVNFTK